MLSIIRLSVTLVRCLPRLGRLLVTVGLLAAPASLSAQELQLLMIERPGCVYCIIFKRDVAPIYHKSPEGQLAPLVHADLRALPEDITFASRPFVTPTFILIDTSGQELERLTGYPGDEFFWPYIHTMITRHLPDDAIAATP